MWLKHRLTNEIAWHAEQHIKLRNLVVFKQQGGAWFKDVWNVDDVSCIDHPFLGHGPF